jgi:uncharacterized membrane protein
MVHNPAYAGAFTWSAELEGRWEESLRASQEAQEQLRTEESRCPCLAIPADLLGHLKDIGGHLPEFWEQKRVQSSQKKSLLRALRVKVVLHRVATDQVRVRLVWRGGLTTTSSRSSQNLVAFLGGKSLASYLRESRFSRWRHIWGLEGGLSATNWAGGIQMASESQARPSRLHSLMRRLTRWFVAGVLIILPVAITVAVIAWVAAFLQQLVGRGTLVGDSITSLGLRFVSDAALAYVLGVVLVLAVIFAIGVAAEFGARRLIQRLLDALLQRIPIVRNVYETSQQVVSLLGQKDSAALKSMRVVFCCFGGETGAGFLALLVSSEKYRINARDYQIIIVPTSPVPIGGGLLFVPAETIQPTELSVEGLISIYVSMGITADQFLGKASHNAP